MGEQYIFGDIREESLRILAPGNKLVRPQVDLSKEDGLGLLARGLYNHFSIVAEVDGEFRQYWTKEADFLNDVNYLPRKLGRRLLEGNRAYCNRIQVGKMVSLERQLARSNEFYPRREMTESAGSEEEIRSEISELSWVGFVVSNGMASTMGGLTLAILSHYGKAPVMVCKEPSAWVFMGLCLVAARYLNVGGEAWDIEMYHNALRDRAIHAGSVIDVVQELGT